MNSNSKFSQNRNDIKKDLLFEIDEETYNDIKKDLLFYISEERFSCSTLLDLVKLSPGNWFDVEELSYRNSLSRMCKDWEIIVKIIKTIDEFEYNDKTGQIRIKNSNLIFDDIINEKTVLFYCKNEVNKIEFNENKLLEIITENKLNMKLLRFIKFPQLKRRDLHPLYPILKNKITDKSSDIAILKMSSRIEAIKIKKIINECYKDTGSCFAITNYFPYGCLSINLTENQDSVEPEPILIEHSMTDSTLIVSNYVYRANEYPVILDHLIENDLKPTIYRSFVEHRINRNMRQLSRRCISIPFSNIGVFSLITFDSIDKANEASCLIKNLIDYLDVKTFKEVRNFKIQEQHSNNSNKISNEDPSIEDELETVETNPHNLNINIANLSLHQENTGD